MKLHIHRHLSSKLRVRGTHVHARSEAIEKNDNCTSCFFCYNIIQRCAVGQTGLIPYFTTLIQIELFSTLIPKLIMYRSYICVIYKPGLCPLDILLAMK